jgi:hypothetical protein
MRLYLMWTHREQSCLDEVWKGNASEELADVVRHHAGSGIVTPSCSMYRGCRVRPGPS